MTRIVKDYNVRRNEILDVAQRLFHRKGFEPTAIQDIVDDVGVAKGTFYHYFISKMDLLDALIERMLSQTLKSVEPIVDDDQLNAPEKFTAFFAHLHSWKIENKAFFLDVLRVWQKDENAIFRHKLRVMSGRSVVPLLTQIIHQGVAEGVFVTDYPDDLGEILLQIGQSVSETVSELLLRMEKDDHTLDIVARKVTVYEHAVERLLGAPSGTLNIFDFNLVKLWFD
ncbi:MAG: TetR/AcrR family transcriptional regulator [Ardenticatenia bacterium]|nr:TetR/AcrR family transcriptional regulator [Ardenticatenia bacterium]